MKACHKMQITTNSPQNGRRRSKKYQGFIYIGGRSTDPDDEKEVKTEPKESEDDNDTPRWF
jgi:hypothetical protein